MNHRKRVLLSLNHEEADRIPLDLWGSDSRINNELYFKIVEKLGIEPLKNKTRPGKSSEYTDYRLSDIFDVDFRHPIFGSSKIFKSYLDKNENVIDEWGIGYKMVGGKQQITYHPFHDCENPDEISKHNWPLAEDEGRIEKIKEEIKQFNVEKEYYVSTSTITSGFIFDFCWYLRGMDKFLMDLYINKKFAHKLIEEVSKKMLEIHSFCLAAVKDDIDGIEFASDFGTQKQPFIPKIVFDEFFKDPMKNIFEELKKLVKGVKIFLHSCGSVRELIPSFIDAGVDVLSSLQPLAFDMNSFEIKKEFGRDISFRGGIDIQRAILGSEKDVELEVKTRIKAFAPGGGYIFGPSNHFQSDVPAENVLKLYNTAKKYGQYPINIK